MKKHQDIAQEYQQANEIAIGDDRVSLAIVLGPITNKKAILRLREVIEMSRSWSIGVMESWDIKKGVKPSANTPVLQYFEIYRNLKRQDGFHSFGF